MRKGSVTLTSLQKLNRNAIIYYLFASHDHYLVCG